MNDGQVISRLKVKKGKEIDYRHNDATNDLSIPCH